MKVNEMMDYISNIRENLKEETPPLLNLDFSMNEKMNDEAVDNDIDVS